MFAEPSVCNSLWSTADCVKAAFASTRSSIHFGRCTDLHADMIFEASSL